MDVQFAGNKLNGVEIEQVYQIEGARRDDEFSVDVVNGGSID